MAGKRRVSNRTSRRASIKRTSPNKIVVGSPVLFETKKGRNVKATYVIFMSPVKKRVVSKRKTPRRK